MQLYRNPEFQNHDNEGDPGSQRQNGKDSINVFQRLR